MFAHRMFVYTSSIAVLLGSLLAWLLLYQEDPSQASLAELQSLTEEIKTVSDSESTEENGEPEPLHTVMGWWYPGPPACSAMQEAGQYQLDVVKPEYFAIRSGGELEFMTDDIYACNGYSSSTVALVRSLADQQFVMVSSASAADMQQFLEQDEQTGEHVDRLVSFVTDTSFTGVELDFEDFGGWDANLYEQYLAFVTRLGDALHAQDKQLMLDLPAVQNAAEEQWYTLRLSDFDDLPVDYLVIMAYDYQFNHGVGESVTPLEWLSEVVMFTRSRVQDESRIVIGLPSYGYVGNYDTQDIRIVTAAQAAEHPLYQQLKRDARSAELLATTTDAALVVSDEQSVAAKVRTVQEAGIGAVSIWHLGGNPWFAVERQ